jgi:hypothetical protein
VPSDVQEAILIHRDGTFLGRYPLLSPSPVDWSAQARALLDMMNSVGASLASAPHALRDLQFEDTTLHLEIGEQLILVTVIVGRVRPSLVRRLRAFLEDLELNYRDALAHWEGRPEGFVGLDRFLRRIVV